MRRRVLFLITAGLAFGLCGYVFTSHVEAQNQTPVPTFAKDVAPILYKNCAGCHRPGEIGPMPLLSYDDARPYAGDIRDQVKAGHMPPWHADPRFGAFRNERKLTDAEKATIIRWADGGAPRGNDRDLPPVPKFAEGWSIGTPDAILKLPQEYEVPASGTIEYQYFEVPTNWTEPKWIQAMEVRPGARSVVHHVLVYAREPAGLPARPRALQPVRTNGNVLNLNPPTPPVIPPAGTQPPVTPPTTPPATPPAGAAPRVLGGLIASNAPGTNAMVYEPGTALLIRPGAVLTFQVHYTASGKATKDQSSIGFMFAKNPPAEEIRVGQFINTQLQLPAGVSDQRVDAGVTVLEDVHLVGLLPHTHLRGTRWEYKVVYPDGRSEVILAMPKYDFNWQTYFMFKTPLALPKGSRIESSAWYDNSATNKSNPDPKVNVRWGDQTWEEMQYTGITYTVDSQKKPAGGTSPAPGAKK
jgi:hypothetical protein